MTKMLFHVGPPKTGSTSIQHFLNGNSEALARLGILYAPRVEPAFFELQHADTAQHLQVGDWVQVKKFSEQVRAATAESEPDFVIASSEAFASILDESAWTQFLTCFEEFSPTLAFVKRDIRPLIKSSFYQQLEGNVGYLHRYNTISEFVVATADWFRRQQSFFESMGAAMLSFEDMSGTGKFCSSFVSTLTGKIVDLEEKQLNTTGSNFPKSRYFWTYPLRRMISLQDGSPVDAAATRQTANRIVTNIHYDEDKLQRLRQDINDQIDAALEAHA